MDRKSRKITKKRLHKRNMICLSIFSEKKKKRN